MNAVVQHLVQGTKPWHDFRASHYGASDAPVMMGCSKYRQRSALVAEKATGIVPEVSAQTQRLFDHGHAAEAVMRKAIERQLCEDLYPATLALDVDGLPLSASLDGQTLDGDTLFEAKLWNESLAAHVRNGELEPHYYWQLEQQLLVSGAEHVIFATGDENGQMETMEYRAVPGRAEALIAGWKQFANDVAAYEPEAEAPRVNSGVTPETLPALTVHVEGKVLATNLDDFRAHAMAVLGSINRELVTDQDFSDADATVKWCKSVESKLAAAKDNVLGQMATVDEVCRTIDDLSAETRRVRLDLDKLVKAEKDHRKTQIVQHYIGLVRKHYDTVNASMGQHAIQAPQSLSLDIGSAIKGLKTLGSITDAADAAAVNLKIAASQRADKIRAAIKVLDEFSDHAHLFADRVSLCATKSPDDLRNLAKARIAEHEAEDRQRIDAEATRQAEAQRERIRAEERATAEREVHQQAMDSAMVPAGDHLVTPAYMPVDDRLVKLSDINRAVAPLSITANGLHELAGITPIEVRGRSKMYRMHDALKALDAMRVVTVRAIGLVDEYADQTEVPA